MTVYIVFGYNGIMNAYGPVGVAKTKEGAIKIQQEHEYILSESKIIETSLKN